MVGEEREEGGIGMLAEGLSPVIFLDREKNHFTKLASGFHPGRQVLLTCGHGGLALGLEKEKENATDKEGVSTRAIMVAHMSIQKEPNCYHSALQMLYLFC